MINRRIDYTLLKVDAEYSDIAALCNTAANRGFFAVCIPPCYLSLAVGLLKDSGVKIATVVDYPNGFSPTEVKLHASQVAILDGAEELDVVLNISRLKSGNHEYLSAEIKALRELTRKKNVVLKLIIEAALLTDEELEAVCELAAMHQIDFVKNSTGVNGGSATPGLIAKMRTLLPEAIQVKASGGIKTSELAQELIDAGASRIGTSSLLPDIICV